MKLRKQTKRIMIGCVSVAIAAVGTWALGTIPILVTESLNAANGATGSPELELGKGAAAQIERVVDGDTFVISDHGDSPRVRIIGIDTPELGRNGNPDDCFAQESTTALTAALSAGPIELVADPSQGDTDNYGRLLRHVTVNGQSVAVTMLAAGMGHEYTYDTPYAGLADHQAAEAAARDSGAGLWSACQ